MRFALAILVVVMVVGSAPAAVTSSWQSVDSAAALPDFVTVDWTVHTDGVWTSSELLVTLGAGEIFQQPLELGGSDAPPDPALLALPGFETLEFDSYLTAGLNAMSSVPTVTAGAVDLGGGADVQFDSDGISVTWIDLEGGAIGDLILARLSISKNAEGRWALRLASAGDVAVMQSGSIAELIAARSIAAPAADQSVVALNGTGIPGDCSSPGNPGQPDGCVNQADLDLLVQYWGWNGRNTNPQEDPAPPADINCDRFVGADDLDIIRAHWGQVPEPSTVVMLVGAAFLLLLRFRRS